MHIWILVILSILAVFWPRRVRAAHAGTEWLFVALWFVALLLLIYDFPRMWDICRHARVGDRH